VEPEASVPLAPATTPALEDPPIANEAGAERATL